MAPPWVSLDPGLRCCGLAIWHGTGLVWAGLVKGAPTGRGPLAWARMSWAVNRATCAQGFGPHDGGGIVTEYPQVYRHGPGDPADLIELAGVVGAVAGQYIGGQITGYLPREWKGQVPKDVMCARIMSKLTPEEALAIQPCAPSLLHNVQDAIGIGLFHMQKLGQRRA